MLRFGFAGRPFFVGSKTLGGRGGCILFQKSRLGFADVLQPCCPPKTSVVPLPFQHHPLEVACRLPISKNVPAAFRVIHDFGGFFFAVKGFWRQSVFLHFLCYSAYAFPRSLCGTSRPFPTTLGELFQSFLVGHYARHPNRHTRSLAECGELTWRCYLWLLHLLAQWLFLPHPLDALCR